MKHDDPWAEYGKPITFASVVLEPEPVAEEGRKVTIDELEKMLESEADMAIQILPDGSITTRPMTDEDRSNRTPLTMRENLGGEYGPKVCNLAAWFGLPDVGYQPHYGRKAKAKGRRSSTTGGNP